MGSRCMHRETGDSDGCIGRLETVMGSRCMHRETGGCDGVKVHA